MRVLLVALQMKEVDIGDFAGTRQDLEWELREGCTNLWSVGLFDSPYSQGWLQCFRLLSALGDAEGDAMALQSRLLAVFPPLPSLLPAPPSSSTPNPLYVLHTFLWQPQSFHDALEMELRRAAQALKSLRLLSRRHVRAHFEAERPAKQDRVRQQLEREAGVLCGGYLESEQASASFAPLRQYLLQLLELETRRVLRTMQEMGSGAVPREEGWAEKEGQSQGVELGFLSLTQAFQLSEETVLEKAGSSVPPVSSQQRRSLLYSRTRKGVTRDPAPPTSPNPPKQTTALAVLLGWTRYLLGLGIAVGLGMWWMLRRDQKAALRALDTGTTKKGASSKGKRLERHAHSPLSPPPTPRSPLAFHSIHLLVEQGGLRALWTALLGALRREDTEEALAASTTVSLPSSPQGRKAHRKRSKRAGKVESGGDGGGHDDSGERMASITDGEEDQPQEQGIQKVEGFESSDGEESGGFSVIEQPSIPHQPDVFDYSWWERHGEREEEEGEWVSVEAKGKRTKAAKATCGQYQGGLARVKDSALLSTPAPNPAPASSMLRQQRTSSLPNRSTKIQTTLVVHPLPTQPLPVILSAPSCSPRSQESTITTLADEGEHSSLEGEEGASYPCLYPSYPVSPYFPLAAQTAHLPLPPTAYLSSTSAYMVAESMIHPNSAIGYPQPEHLVPLYHPSERALIPAPPAIMHILILVQKQM